MTKNQTIKQAIIDKAESDPSFLAELKKDPKAAIKKHFPQPDGRTIPDEVEVIIVEDTKDKAYINVDPSGSAKGGY